MPTHIRAQCTWQTETMLPRDGVTITPCFRHQFDPLTLTDIDWQDLCDDLCDGIRSQDYGTTSRQFTVKLYEIKDPVPGVPNRPKATKTLSAGAFSPSLGPSEVALCLSFNGGSAGPYERGRLYIPCFYFRTTAPTQNRPPSADRTACASLVSIFAELGGSNVDWGVWSPTKKEFTKAENWYIDDEWDTQRRRGLKPTTRTTGTTTG